MPKVKIGGTNRATDGDLLEIAPKPHFDHLRSNWLSTRHGGAALHAVATPLPARPLLTKTTHCRACGNGKLIPVLDLGEQALTGRFPAANEPDPPVAPLELWICDTTSATDACGLGQLGHTCDLGQMYGPTYGYRSSITQTMVAHLRSIAGALTAVAKPEAGDWLLEIGSNDGTMQGFLSGRGYNLVAIDPSAAKFAENYPADSRLIVDFFSANAVKAASSGNKFKAILSIAMFYDLERPLDFMGDVRELLADDGVWCFEQAYLPAMLSSLCYDTICHEHLCYYSLSQISWMARRAGLRIIDVATNDINGGSFTVFACREEARRPANTAKIARMLDAENRAKLLDPATWHEFARRVRHHRARLRTFFEDARAAGDLVLGLGASTKGNVLLQYAGIDETLMPAIGERDPRKVGLRTPRTAIPIISEEDARRMKPRYFFVFPWHFRNEIAEREKSFLEAGGRLVFPLPRFEVVGQDTAQRPAATNLPSGRRIPWAEPMFFGDERAFVSEALDSTMISGGGFVDRFEREFAAMHGNGAAAIATSNGTTAIELAYRAIGIGPGDEVIVPGWGFMAAANMALAVGATPVYADVDARDWLLDPVAVAKKIGPKTKAIVATHTYGNVCDMAALATLAHERGIALIEDCAESLGSTRSGRMAGTFGDIGSFSFQATKTVTCGEGGAILVRDPKVAARARLIRSHGMEGRRRYWHHEVGHNFRLSNLHCAVLCAQLGHWPMIVEIRARLYDGYRRRLAGKPRIGFQHFAPEVTPVVWATGVRLEGFTAARRDDLIDRMENRGIECRPGFYAPSVQPIYDAAPVGVSEEIADQVIVLPLGSTLSEQDLDFICDSLLGEMESIAHG